MCHQIAKNDLKETMERDGDDEIITIHVSGRTFQTYVQTLQRYPDTLLGDENRRNRFKDPTTGAIFLDRHSGAFEYILYFYQSEGIIHCPRHVSVNAFMKEVFFFQLPPQAIARFKKDLGVEEKQPEVKHVRTFPIVGALWDFLEHPESSIGARIYTWLQIGVIMLSLAMFVMESMPQFAISQSRTYTQDENLILHNVCKEINIADDRENITNEHRAIEVLDTSCHTRLIHICEGLNSTVNLTATMKTHNTNWTHVCRLIFQMNIVDEHKWIHIVNTAIIVWFTTEFILRSAVCPSKLRYMLNPETWVDLLSILPYYLSLVVTSSNTRLLSVIRVVRVLRVFKLSRHSTSLQLLIKTLRAAR